MVQSSAILKRYIIRASACFGTAFLCAVLFDYGHYLKTLDNDGLFGFLKLPSILVFQLGFLVSEAFLLRVTIRIGLSGRFSKIAWVLGFSTVGYGLSLLGIAWASKAGEFGIGPAFVFMVLFLLSAALIYFVVPGVLVRAITRKCD